MSQQNFNGFEILQQAEAAGMRMGSYLSNGETRLLVHLDHGTGRRACRELIEWADGSEGVVVAPVKGDILTDAMIAAAVETALDELAADAAE